MAAQEARSVLDAVLARRAPDGLSGADRAIDGFVRRLSRSPAESTEAHIIELRGHGFDDRAIYDIVAITGFFGFVNRVALGLGIPLEEHWEQFLTSTLSRPEQRAE